MRCLARVALTVGTGLLPVAGTTVTAQADAPHQPSTRSAGFDNVGFTQVIEFAKLAVGFAVELAEV